MIQVAETVTSSFELKEKERKRRDSMSQANLEILFYKIRSVLML